MDCTNNCKQLGRTCGKCDTSKGRTVKVTGRLTPVKLWAVASFQFHGAKENFGRGLKKTSKFF